jgi:hypothetical protein
VRYNCRSAVTCSIDTEIVAPANCKAHYCVHAATSDAEFDASPPKHHHTPPPGARQCDNIARRYYCLPLAMFMIAIVITVSAMLFNSQNAHFADASDAVVLNDSLSTRSGVSHKILLLASLVFYFSSRKWHVVAISLGPYVRF